jgi:transaldolase
VTEAFIGGLEDRAKTGQSLERIDSVASFFLSRIDVLIDPQLEKMVADGKTEAQPLVGEVAIASAKVAYEMYKQIFSGPRWQALADKGAHTQRLLWASTGNKNPKYDDLKYVEALIGPKTVDTVPVETMDLFKERGKPADRLEEGLDKAHQVLDALPGLGLNLDELTQQLEDDGVKKFIDPFGKLLDSVEKKRKQAAEGAEALK